jgi:hypothetical protein
MLGISGIALHSLHFLMTPGPFTTKGLLSQNPFIKATTAKSVKPAVGQATLWL